RAGRARDARPPATCFCSVAPAVPESEPMLSSNQVPNQSMSATFLEPSRQDISAMRIILVDDHAIVREGVRAILELQEDMQVVGEFANGAEALAAAAALAPHLALVDLKMPGLSAVETIR